MRSSDIINILTPLLYEHKGKSNTTSKFYISLLEDTIILNNQYFHSKGKTNFKCHIRNIIKIVRTTKNIRVICRINKNVITIIYSHNNISKKFKRILK